MTWIIYTRVSTEDQATMGASLPAQLDSCAGFIKFTMGIDDYELISDPGLSAKNLKRPGIQKIIERINAGNVTGVCVWKLDRLTRKTSDLLRLVDMFNDKGVALASVQERIDTSGPMGVMMLTIMGAIAQLEREQIGERTKLGMEARKKEGKFTGGTIPIGFKVIDADTGGRQLQPDKKIAPIMAGAWKKIIAGKSVKQAAAELTKEGILPNGKTMSQQRLNNLLKNERYIDAIIDAETFTEANEILGNRAFRQRQNIQRHGERNWLLKGLGHCHKCGGELIGSSSRGRNKTIYHYYRCINQVKKENTVCDARALPADEFEQFVIERLAFTLQDTTLLESQMQRVIARAMTCGQNVSDDIKQLQKQRDDIAKRIDKLLEFFLAEDIDDQGAFADKLKTLQREQNEIERQIGGQNGLLAAVEVKSQQCATVAKALTRYGKRLLTLGEDDLTIALPILIHRIEASVDHLSLDINKPGTVLGAGFEQKWGAMFVCENTIRFQWNLETRSRSGVNGRHGFILNYEMVRP